MGVVRDGKISGFLPNTEAFAVHYPGYPSSIDRAVHSLGGVDAIIKARSSQLNTIEISFRPEDPCAHPASGELRLCNNLLFKVSKGMPCRAQTAQTITTSSKKAEFHEEETCLFAEIIAQIPEAYHFKGMADYQHVVAVHADTMRTKKRNWSEVELQRYEKPSFMDLDQEDVMILLPPVFAPKDIPENLVLRASTASNQKTKQDNAHNHPVINIEPALLIDFSVKEIPSKVIWEEVIPQGSLHWEMQMVVSKMFDERPIWPKETVAQHLLDKGLKVSNQMLKRLLLGVAYYFSGGPFFRFWIKKAYDPRKDPESRRYQRMDFRVHPSLKSYCDACTAKGLKHRWEDLCAFRVFPYKCHTAVQLFELEDDYIQQEIRKPPTQKTCTHETGWFSRHSLDAMRLCIVVRFMSKYPRSGAEKLLKAAREKFEKLKTAYLYKNNSLDQLEQQRVTEEVEHDTDNGRQTNDDDDDDDEIDEEHDLIDEEADILFHSGLYTGTGNNSRVYLQELFDTFPPMDAGGDKTQDAETSDGEYKIYEQDSDEDYNN